MGMQHYDFPEKGQIRDSDELLRIIIYMICLHKNNCSYSFWEYADYLYETWIFLRVTTISPPIGSTNIQPLPKIQQTD